jgi:hypothetical protein
MKLNKQVILNGFNNSKRKQENKTIILNILKRIIEQIKIKSNKDENFQFNGNLNSLNKKDSVISIKDLRFNRSSEWYYEDNEFSKVYFTINLNGFDKWKFGLDLYVHRTEEEIIENNDDYFSYYLYGEAITLIDKFKPSRTVISETSINGFVDKLFKFKFYKDYLNTTKLSKDLKEELIEIKKYNDRMEFSLKQDKISKEYNELNLKRIKNYIKQTQDNYLKDKDKYKSYLTLTDRNTKDSNVWPRYVITEYTTLNDYFSSNDIEMIKKYDETSKQFFLDLCDLIEYSGNFNKNKFDDDNFLYKTIDDFLFENLMLRNKKDKDEEHDMWNHQENFENYVKKFG